MDIRDKLPGYKLDLLNNFTDALDQYVDARISHWIARFEHNGEPGFDEITHATRALEWALIQLLG